jgi:hypothetical protein
VAELVRKDAAVHADGYGLRNGRGGDQYRVGFNCTVMTRLPDVDDGEGGSESNGDACHEACNAHDDVSLHWHSSDAHDPHLKTERDHDEDGEQERENVCSGCSGKVSLCDLSVVVGQLRERVPYGTCREATAQNHADDVDHETERVGDEEARLALLGPGQQKQHSEEDDRGANLCSVVDRDACGIHAEPVERGQVELDGAAVCFDENNIL